MKIEAVSEAMNHMSLNKALIYCGMSKRAWYHVHHPRDVPVDADIVRVVKDIASRRPTYGTRRMAVQIKREMGIAVNRKQIQRIYRKIGYIEPQKTKNDIIKTGRRLFTPEAPNQLWEADITYIWCGVDGWCYSFNILDCFTRKWITYAFDVNATRDVAIRSITEAVAVEKPDCSKLRLRTDNGNQYTSNDFRRAVSALGIGKHEFIWKNTPEQNGHVESFHKTLKKEYIWPCEFKNYQDVEKALAEAFADYNNKRIHSSIEYMTPIEFVAQWEMTNK